MSVESVDAKLLATRDAHIDRVFRLVDLSRLTELAADAQSQGRLAVQFHLVNERAAVAGHASATLKLVCQRCLGSVLVPVDDEFHVVLIDSEDEMDQLPEQQDAIVADAARLDLGWLLEEQLLLAMPLVPTHANSSECMKRKVEVADIATEKSPDAVEPQRPFANLRNLLDEVGSTASGKKPAK